MVGSGSKVILAVDDEQDNLDLVKRILSGYDVRSFTCPQDALEQIADISPAGIIVDFRMPKLDGVAFVRRARTKGAGRIGSP